MTAAVRTGCAVVALVLTALWFADIEWAIFLEHEAVSDILWLGGGAAVGVLAAMAANGRLRLVVIAIAALAAVTVAAFIVMPWDEEAEGGAALILLWAVLAIGAALAACGVLALRRRRAASSPTAV